MRISLEENKNKYVYFILCVLALVITLYPLKCNYIMGGGIVTEWIARMDEIVIGLQMGHLHLFPSVEAILNSGVQANGLNSNLWFIIPGCLYQLSGNLVFAYQVLMIVIQLGTLVGSILFFQRIFAKERTKHAAYFGILLYMTCPYRIFVCYDWANLSQAVAWMLLPFYAWAIAGVIQNKKIKEIVIAGLVLAGIGYADVVFCVILLAVTFCVGIILRKPWTLAAMLVGVVFFLPGLYRLIQYLFLNQLSDLALPIQSIMGNGYRLGEFFRCYVYRDNHPGMGLGMLVCLLTGLWMSFVKGEKEEYKGSYLFSILSLFLAILSFYYFPWDIVQRFGSWALRFVSLMGTPAIFWGLASGCLCIPAALSMGKISKHEDKIIALGIPVFVLIACMGVCIYQNNMLIQDRVPWILP